METIHEEDWKNRPFEPMIKTDSYADNELKNGDSSCSGMLKEENKMEVFERLDSCSLPQDDNTFGIRPSSNTFTNTNEDFGSIVPTSDDLY